MSNNYKFKRDWENAEKAIYDGEGEFGIPVIMPEEYHSVEWIGFNKARVTQNRENKGVHFFLDDYQFVRLWKNILISQVRHILKMEENLKRPIYM